MGRYKYSKTEQQINNVLAYHEKELAGISFPNLKEMDASIAKADPAVYKGSKASSGKEGHADSILESAGCESPDFLWEQ